MLLEGSEFHWGELSKKTPKTQQLEAIKIKTHSIHAWYIIYLDLACFTNKNKDNHSCIGKYTFRPMDSDVLSWQFFPKKKTLVFFWPMAAGRGKISSRGCHVVQWWFFLCRWSSFNGVKRWAVFCGKESVGKDDFPRFIFLDIPRLMPRGSLI